MKSRLNYKSKKTIIIVAIIMLLITIASTGIYIFTKANDKIKAFSKENVSTPENTEVGSNNENKQTVQNEEQGNVQVNTNNNENTIANNTTNNTTNNSTNNKVNTESTTKIEEQEVIDIVKETIETGTDGKYLSWKQTANSIGKITTNVENAEVKVEVTASRDEVEPKEDITYTIKISSNKELEKVPVKDLIPEMTTYKSTENNGKEVVDDNGNIVAVRWEVDLKEDNQYTAEVKFTVTVNEDATGIIVNSEAIANGKRQDNPVEINVLSHILFVENGGTDVEDILNKKSNTTIENREMPITSKVGYIFAGWYDNTNFEGNEITTLPKEYVAGTTTYYAKWIPATDTKYTVKHYQQNVNDDSYTLVDTDNLEGTTDEQTVAVAKEYIGFTTKSFEQNVIAPDGSTVIEIYYDRNVYTITYKITGRIDATDDFAHSNLKYGQDITPVQTPSKTGYTFSGWSTVPEKMPNNDLTVTGSYQANTDTAYKVNHYKQNVNDDNYTLVDTDNLEGTTDEQTVAAAKDYIGFTVKSFEQNVIAPDGSTVIEIYYTRNSYTVIFHANANETTGKTPNQVVKFEEEITLNENKFEKYNYEFKNWNISPDETGTSYEDKANFQLTENNISIVNNNNIELYAQWTLLEAKFDIGANVNKIIKELVNPNINYSIKKSDIAPTNLSICKDVSIASTPIYVWLDEEDTTKVLWYTKDPTPELNQDCSHMFEDQNKLISEDITNVCGTSNVTNMASMFDGCLNLTTLDLTNFDTSNVTNMESMFSDCSNLTILNVSNFNTNKVTDMSSMFDGCSNLTTIDVTNFDTSNVTNMASMFSDCSNLTTLDVSKFNTNKVTDMSNMFEGCSNLTTIDVTNFDTSNVINMASMFSDCSNLTTIDVTNFNTSNVTNMASMFNNCENLTMLNVSKWDTSNVTSMSNMFKNCTNLTTVYASDSYVTNQVKTSEDMFTGCLNIKGGNGTTYDTSHIDKEYARIDTPRTQGYFTPITPYVMFETGSTFNTKIKKLYNDNIATIERPDTEEPLPENNIVTIERASVEPTTEKYIELQTVDSTNFIKMWVDKNDYTKILWYTKVERPQLNSDSSGMFSDLTKLESQDITNICDTSNVTNMSGMFWHCNNLTTLDVSGFDTSNVTDMNRMFSRCGSLTTLDVSGFDTSNVTSIYEIFYRM